MKRFLTSLLVFSCFIPKTTILAQEVSRLVGITNSSTVVQPTCNNPNGSITTTFIGLSPRTYVVDLKDPATGAVLSTTTLTLAGSSVNPPAVNITHPTCNNTTGSITVTNPTSGVTYSFDNGATFQSSNLKTGLAPGTYNVLVKDNVTNCISVATAATINSNTNTLSAPTASVTQPTCTTPTGTITFTSPLTGVTYSFDGGVTFVSSNVKTGLATGTYRLCFRDNITGCISPEITVNVNVAPNSLNAPTVSVSSPTCSNNSGTITVTNPTSGVTYSFDNGVSYQASNVSPYLTPGIYYVRVKDIATGCVSIATIANVTSSFFAFFAPTVTVTQPSCGNPFGTITVTPIAGLTLLYSFDGGATFVSSNVKTGLLPGTYYICVRDVATGCTSNEARAIIINSGGTIAAPLVSVSHPTCNNTTGSITVTSPNIGVTYSFDNGATYQTSNIKTGLASGTYMIKVRDVNTGCISNATTAVINNSGGVFAAPVANVVQPTCSYAFGSITIVTPSSGVTYSFDGGITFVTSNIRTGLLPGTYRLCVRDIVTGCISQEATVIINNAPSAIAAPTVSTIQPTCINSTGTITVTSPSSGVTYSFDNGSSFQTSNVKSGLVAGTYFVRVKETSSGCVSAPTTVYINPATGITFTPTVSVTQPTCANPFGTIIFTYPTSGVTYSFDGGVTFISSNSKTNLAPGTYYVCVRDNVTGCISNEVIVVIYGIPTAPNPPSLTITQPNCVNSFGSITVTSPTTNVTYSFDNGVSFQTSNTKTGLGAGTYLVKVRDITSGCVSTATTATISPSIISSVVPTLSVIQPTCANIYGSITVTSPATGVLYSFDNSASFQMSNIKNGLTAGTYIIRVKDISTGCISNAVSTTINPQPSSLYPPTATVTQPTCGNPLGTITFTSPLSGVTYSFDGGLTFVSSNVKSGLAPGTYRLCVRSIVGNCLSPEITVVINPVSGGTITPYVSVIQPTCTSGGRITVTNLPAGASSRIVSSTYSVENNSGYVVDKTVYDNVKAGMYEVKIKNACGESTTWVTLYPSTVYYSTYKCYKFVNVNSGRALTSTTMLENGPLTQTTYTNMATQQWSLADVGNYLAQIYNRNSHKAMTNASTTEGANVYQENYITGGSADWDIECMGNGYYRIIHRLSGKYLSIEGNSTAENANVEIRSDNQSNPSVYWYMVEVPCMVGTDMRAKVSPTITESAVNNKTVGGGDVQSDKVYNKSLMDDKALSSGGINKPLSKTPEMRIFPNPASDYIDIQLENMPKEEITITLINTVGSRFTEIKSKETQLLRLETPNVPNGLYILQVAEKGKPIMRKEVMIMK